MHFTVLSAIPLPQDIPAAVSTIPTEYTASYTARKLILETLNKEKPPAAPESLSSAAARQQWECLVEYMVSTLLAPYDENSTDIDDTIFNDQTEECLQTYQYGGMNCVRTPDGRIISSCCTEFFRHYELHDGKVYQRHSGPLHHRKRTKAAKKYRVLPNYPYRKLYPTFDDFMVNYQGYEAEEGTGRYGYRFNPDGQWDWWQIGGRWPFCFLVREDCPSAVVGERAYSSIEQPYAPEGYRWAAGARKCDIAWDLMRALYRKQYTEQFHLCREWLQTGKIPEEHAGKIALAKDGVVCWGEYLYREGESLEHHLYNLGLSDQHRYPIHTFAFVDADGWRDRGWGTDNSDGAAFQTWYGEVADFIESQTDDTLLVIVDCHS